MPRNRSEKVPHPEVDPKFHERLRLWGLYKASKGGPGSSAAFAAWANFTDGWSEDDDDAYAELDPDVYQELLDFYIRRAKRERERKNAQKP